MKNTIKKLLNGIFKNNPKGLNAADCIAIYRKNEVLMAEKIYPSEKAIAIQYDAINRLMSDWRYTPIKVETIYEPKIKTILWD